MFHNKLDRTYCFPFLRGPTLVEPHARFEYKLSLIKSDLSPKMECALPFSFHAGDERESALLVFVSMQRDGDRHNSTHSAHRDLPFET